MAVVFISPKQRQRTFFLIITAAFLIVLLIIAVGVLTSSPKEVAPSLVFNRPKVSVNMSVFEQELFKILEPFSEMQVQYSYKALDAKNKEKTGFISAASIEEARKMLEDMKLKVSEIKEVEIGRDNPFAPYYASPATKK